MTPILVIFCILLAVLFLASDLRAMLRDAGQGNVGPLIPGRQWCRTCGTETDGPYYCSEECYPPQEEEE